MKNPFFSLAAALLISSGPLAAQESINLVTFGGAYGDVIQRHMATPFAQQSGHKVLPGAYSGGLAEIKAQVTAGKVMWDVVTIEEADLERACSEGLLEIIDPEQLSSAPDGTQATADFIEGSLAPCGVPTILGSTVFAYNRDTIGKVVPKTLADLFDVQKIPGKRAFQRRATTLLEWALLADGVPRDKVYQVLATEQGLARVFAKLDSIREHIVWFESWSQSPQLLNDGGAVMVQAVNGRIYNAIKQDGKPFVIVWDGNVYGFDRFAIPKGSPRREAALQFIAFATSTAPLSGMADIGYSSPRRSSSLLAAPDLLPFLPATHTQVGLHIHTDFWADYGAMLDEKFSEWLLKGQ
ncbi:spermidine/putrescine ABC transporter substrate-binding protein [Ventosimonas gracilis]|uniref:Spermidine/putrescine ABC transporter substrate-binding protein n=1 Tax=Ventosimonas gracilis TaxID=1680762 RepID=A0A139SWD9_9GAMM|nr:ABC transporter substrate-binding protein [Ventosimonas gracilis]KXU38913.1 spermidine/putrescine ABC transporter substrate-binding protein [Ventosimonas gracilis]